jgi:hypothetical protein
MFEQQHQSFTSWLIWMLLVEASAFGEKHWLPFQMSHCWKLLQKLMGGRMDIAKSLRHEQFITISILLFQEQVAYCSCCSCKLGSG